MKSNIPITVFAGLIIAGVMVMIGASPAVEDSRRYDASVVPMTSDIQIVDHQSNTLYVYGQHEGAFVLRMSLDLTRAGDIKIVPNHPPKDKVQEALQGSDG